MNSKCTYVVTLVQSSSVVSSNDPFYGKRADAPPRLLCLIRSPCTRPQLAARTSTCSTLCSLQPVLHNLSTVSMPNAPTGQSGWARRAAAHKRCWCHACSEVLGRLSCVKEAKKLSHRRLGENAPRRGGHAGHSFARPRGGTWVWSDKPELPSVVEPAGKELSRIEKKRDVMPMA